MPFDETTETVSVLASNVSMLLLPPRDWMQSTLKADGLVPLGTCECTITETSVRLQRHDAQLAADPFVAARPDVAGAARKNYRIEDSVYIVRTPSAGERVHVDADLVAHRQRS